jgi:hypothetical protein
MMMTDDASFAPSCVIRRLMVNDVELMRKERWQSYNWYRNMAEASLVRHDNLA